MQTIIFYYWKNSKLPKVPSSEDWLKTQLTADWLTDWLTGPRDPLSPDVPPGRVPLRLDDGRRAHRLLRRGEEGEEEQEGEEGHDDDDEEEEEEMAQRRRRRLRRRRHGRQGERREDGGPVLLRQR